MNRYLDAGSVFVVVLTLLLFIAALFVKGFTHDLLLEAGVFLVSVKLILANYKTRQAEEILNGKLDRILERLDRPGGPPGGRLP
jgi:hypothetical protein